MQMIRKHLWIKDILTVVRQKFEKVQDTTAQRSRDYSLTDCLMSGLAIFGAWFRGTEHFLKFMMWL